MSTAPPKNSAFDLYLAPKALPEVQHHSRKIHLSRGYLPCIRKKYSLPHGNHAAACLDGMVPEVAKGFEHGQCGKQKCVPKGTHFLVLHQDGLSPLAGADIGFCRGRLCSQPLQFFQKLRFRQILVEYFLHCFVPLVRRNEFYRF